MESHPEESSEAPGRRTGSVAVLPHYYVLPLISCTLPLRARKLDVLIGDTAILDYFRANDPGCNLNLLGDSIFDDAYAVAMHKGFPLKVITHSTHALPSLSRTPSSPLSDLFSASVPRQQRDSYVLQQAISNLILEYSTYGFLDQLQRKWFVVKG